MFRRPTCMEACLAQGKPYHECDMWCNHIYISSPYLIPTTAPYALSQPFPYIPSSKPYSYTYGQQTDPRWECYYQCRSSGGSPASCCYYCELC